jgi:undecaprenyl-diphosphatase
MIAELFERRRTRRGIELKDLDHIGWREAITIGFWQAVALIPGSSRSGVTLTGGLFLGLRRETAARFSFLLSLPSVFAAGMFEMYRQRNELLSSEIGFLNLLIATIVSGIVGYLSIAFLLNYLKTHTTTLFIVYRLIVGIALLILVLTNSIVP